MGYVERKTRYFEVSGRENTDAVLEIVREYVQEFNIRNVVVASTTGETGVKTSELLKGLNVVVITHHAGFSSQRPQELSEHNRQKILMNNAKILTATHALSGVERAVRKKFATIELLELIATTLRLFGEGTKVCVEIVLMAADAGLISANEDVVAIGGSGRGADTALLMKPANSSCFFDLEIKEILAKPRNFQ